MKIRPLLNVNWKDNVLEKIENIFSTIQSREIPISSDVINKIPIEIILQTSQLKQIKKKKLNWPSPKRCLPLKKMTSCN